VAELGINSFFLVPIIDRHTHRFLSPIIDRPIVFISEWSDNRYSDSPKAEKITRPDSLKCLIFNTTAGQGDSIGAPARAETLGQYSMVFRRQFNK